MWLDRLSGQSNPSDSPAPRRLNHLTPNTTTRPAYGPRTSSLGLGSRANLSTTSLNSPRLPNASSLRQQLSPPADVADPLIVLQDILGKRSESVNITLNDHNGSTNAQKPPHLADDVDFDGLSLQAFADTSNHDERTESVQASTQTAEECEYVCTSAQTTLICR